MATLGPAIARACGFAATVPLAGSGAVPRVVRGALAIALVPPVMANADTATHGASLSGIAREAFVGASFGLAASIVAAAAAAAGALVDSSLAMRPSGRESVFGGSEGPFGRLYSLAFAAAFASSGALTAVCARFVGASSSPAFDVSVRGAAALAAASVGSALDIAAPAIAAQFVATLVAAIAARAASGLSGLSLASPLATATVLVAALCGAGSSLHVLAELARRAASAGPL